MYHGGMQRSPEEDDRRRKEQHPRSPTHGHPCSPTTNGNFASLQYEQYTPRASSNITSSARSPRLGSTVSPKMNGPTSQTTLPAYSASTGSTRYDPLSEHREGNAARRHEYEPRSPTNIREPLHTLNGQSPESKASPAPYRPEGEARFHYASPKTPASHAHPSNRHGSQQLSPARITFERPMVGPPTSSRSPHTNGFGDRPSSQGTIDDEVTQSPKAPKDDPPASRRADPMSFSNILSGDTPEPPKPKPTPRSLPSTKAAKSTSHTPNGEAKITPAPSRKFASKSTAPRSTPSQARASVKSEHDHPPTRRATGGGTKRRSALNLEKENEKIEAEMAKIEAMDLSDVESPGHEQARNTFIKLKLKRQVDIEDSESVKRKRRRIAYGSYLSIKISTQADLGKQRFRDIYEQQALAEVQQKEIQDEKERKKDMQRKRRREKTLQQQTQLQKEAYSAAMNAADEAEKEKHLKEAQKAAKKVVTTQRILERADVPDGIREVTPLAPNLEGGTMSTFQSANNASPEPPRKKSRGMTTRPKKSKEKKRAEKDAAEAGFAAMQQRDELPPIAPRESSRRESTREAREIKPHREARRESTPAPTAATTYTSKGYNQIYEQIWKDISRKDIPKVCRVKDNSLSTKQSNLRKTAQLAAKEARRWQLRTNKGTKDVQARAKRSMREMMTFWKRNERTERDLRKNAEKQELENAKKAEAEREANRQKRKLNFLISQTELYSHFISSKIKTDEIERSTDSPDVNASKETVRPGKPNAHTINLPESVADLSAKVTNFEDLDFDAEDETALQQAAMANAQNAVQEAQDRARAFNKTSDNVQSQFDDGDMNFQNPTGLEDINVSQPKMLAAQLKEYQLTGLNWLAGLYEKGINGILADEMGLGKTVQSISVMAYLAEKYDIWGPFLVVAPSSTLHNWQQEISKFVPTLKCLPYWGNAKDRKVLRKFWDRKHITYSQNSPFHVLVTSYQLVVADSQYFQKIKWQYMILDEAQAIKSSQSSRWKSLLGFHCRNRLLLTGTPIQNNMQELWALLHFIMPSLFDSHDEFSDWFSKDIENHAQSNSKLNEDQLMRLHTILKPFMLRRVKKNVQKELGDKVEKDVYCNLTYRQRAYYENLKNKISIMDLIEKAAVGDDQDTATLMNLVMQFRKVCNHPDLFERAETNSPFSAVHWAETASFLREGNSVNVSYSTRNLIEYELPRLLCGPDGYLNMPGPTNAKAGFRSRYLQELMNIWTPENILRNTAGNATFSWLRFANVSAGEVYRASHLGPGERAIRLARQKRDLGKLKVIYDGSDDGHFTPTYALFNIREYKERQPLADITTENRLQSLLNVSKKKFEDDGLSYLEAGKRAGAAAPPIQISCSNQQAQYDRDVTIFNVPLRRALYGLSEKDDAAILAAKLPLTSFPTCNLLPPPLSQRSRYTNIQVPSMRRFVTDSGKLASLDRLLNELKEGGHRVLLYFQMTRMIDLMEEYLTYRNYKYLRLDGSTKLEDRRDTVADFQTKPEIFVFLLSTRAGGLGINLTAADTVIFYDSDWNPTIDSQAMDRAHRLGQTRQVTVYRMITRSTIEERIRKRALQKEEVQRVVIQGGSGAGVDFNTRSKENRAKDMALWLADDDQAELIERKEQEAAAKGENEGKKSGRKKAALRKRDVNLDDMYHEGEGHFDDGSNKPSGTATPIEPAEPTPGKRKGTSKKAKTAKQRLAIAEGSGI